MSMPSAFEPVQPVELALAPDGTSADLPAEAAASPVPLDSADAAAEGGWNDGAPGGLADGPLAPVGLSVTVGQLRRPSAGAPAPVTKPGIRGRFFLLAGAACLFLALGMFFIGAWYGDTSTSDSSQWTGALTQLCSVVPCLAAVGLLTFGAAYGVMRRLT
jgi:hypothetical protein